MKKIIALLLAAIMLLGLLAGCASQDPKSSDSAPVTTPSTEPEKTEPAELEYTWDVHVIFRNYDVVGGEKVPVVTLSNKSSGDTASLDVSPMLTEDFLSAHAADAQVNPVAQDVEIRTKSADSALVDNLDAWTVTDEESGALYAFEVVTPLVEGDPESHGELTILITPPEYCWNITVSYENGACGEYVFVNPGLDGFDEKYMNQRFTFTPDNNTAQMPIFNQSGWIVDNSQEWYRWVVTDVSEEDPDITYEVVTPLVLGERLTPGELVIHISL